MCGIEIWQGFATGFSNKLEMYDYGFLLCKLDCRYSL